MMCDGTDVLLLDCLPVLCRFDHPRAVQYSEPESMVDVVPTAINSPAVFFVIWNSSRFDNNVLDISPRQVATEILFTKSNFEKEIIKLMSPHDTQDHM